MAPSFPYEEMYNILQKENIVVCCDILSRTLPIYKSIIIFLMIMDHIQNANIANHYKIDYSKDFIIRKMDQLKDSGNKIKKFFYERLLVINVEPWTKPL